MDDGCTVAEQRRQPAAIPLTRLERAYLKNERQKRRCRISGSSSSSSTSNNNNNCCRATSADGRALRTSLRPVQRAGRLGGPYTGGRQADRLTGRWKNRRTRLETQVVNYAAKYFWPTSKHSSHKSVTACQREVDWRPRRVASAENLWRNVAQTENT